MSRKAPYVTFHDVADDLAHYQASVALDEVLAWFVEDGYMASDLEDLALEHVERACEDDE